RGHHRGLQEGRTGDQEGLRRVHAGLEPADSDDEDRMGRELPHDTELFPREGLSWSLSKLGRARGMCRARLGNLPPVRRISMTRRAAAYLTAGLLVTVPALACTDVRLIATDGSAFTVRTMEFAADLNSETVIMPRGRTFTSPGPKTPGLSWTSKYGFVFMNALREQAVTEGLNEKGLGFGALYLPGETEYETIKAGEEGHALSNIQFGAWVLGNFATVDEVRNALDGVRVWAEPVPQLGS